MSSHSIIHYWGRLLGVWRNHWLLRWVLMHMLGWGLGLMAGAVVIGLLGGVGVLIAGAVFGMVWAIPVAWVLFVTQAKRARHRWVIYSGLGVWFASLPALILTIIGLFNLWLAGLLIGMLTGALLGAMQALVLRTPIGEHVYLWVLVQMLAGGVAGVLTVLVLRTPIPLLCSPAIIVFALINGGLMRRWLRASDQDSPFSSLHSKDRHSRPL
ncbi:MAG: hypothetical protein ACFE0Q_21305 [Anaerolineae bacterium]